MCGVIAAINPRAGSVEGAVAAMRHRGTDAESIWSDGHVSLGHVRLSVIDPGSRSDQPMARGNVVLSYNGEVWNYRDLRAELAALGCSFTTEGDTEVVAWALDRWGVGALTRMEGMWGLAWYDGSTLRFCRDRFGEVPLHWSNSRGSIVVASELKGLVAAGCESFADVGPGQLVEVGPGGPMVSRWYRPSITPSPIDLDEAAAALRSRLVESCAERSMSDAPRCALLSGGIDSSIVLALLKGAVPELVAYTAVMDERSPDLRAARRVAGEIGVELREVRVEPPTPDDLAAVVRAIEQPSKAQVEIGWACLALARAMKGDGFKVTFSGEGSDELWGSYGFAFHALKVKGWHEYRRDLFLAQASRNFPRCNKVFMAHSIECRLPFLNHRLVELALSLRRDAVQDGRSKPKAVLQRAARGLVSDSIIGRQKAAFQDALGMKAAAARSVASPAAFYRAEYVRQYGGHRT